MEPVGILGIIMFILNPTNSSKILCPVAHSLYPTFININAQVIHPCSLRNLRSLGKFDEKF